MDYDKYKNSTPRPRRPQDLLGPAERKILTKHRVLEPLEADEKKRAAYKTAWQAWQKENTRLHAVVFKADALEECGIADHPKADAAFDLAWTEGHDEGLSGVYDWLEMLSELMLSEREMREHLRTQPGAWK